MECDHEGAQWFSISDSIATYFIVRCDICKRVGLLGNTRDSSVLEAESKPAVQWAEPVPDGPPVHLATVRVPKQRSEAYTQYITGLRCVTCGARWIECHGDVAPHDGHVHDFPEAGWPMSSKDPS